MRFANRRTLTIASAVLILGVVPALIALFGPSDLGAGRGIRTSWTPARTAHANAPTVTGVQAMNTKISLEGTTLVASLNRAEAYWKVDVSWLHTGGSPLPPPPPSKGDGGDERDGGD
jgi:hypothetical protein